MDSAIWMLQVSRSQKRHNNLHFGSRGRLKYSTRLIWKMTKEEVWNSQSEIWVAFCQEEKCHLWTGCSISANKKTESQLMSSLRHCIHLLNTEYGSLWDEMIWDRIMVGIRDASHALKLQLDAELMLEKALKAVQETIKSNSPSIWVMGPAPGRDATATVGAIQTNERIQKWIDDLLYANRQKIELSVSDVESHSLMIVDTAQPRMKLVMTGQRGHFKIDSVQITKEDQRSSPRQDEQESDVFLGAVGSNL